jgi:hypothetical protein
MKKQPCHLSRGSYIVHEADERNQCQGKQEPGIFKAARQETGQRPEIEDNPTTAQSHFRMGTPFIGLVDDIAPVSHLKIKKFCQKQQNQNHQIIHHPFLIIQ